MPNNTHIHLDGFGKFSEPVKLFVKKVFDVADVWLVAKRIRKTAEAEADARKIETRSLITTERMLAQAKIQDDPLAQRGLTRFVHEQIKAQENMEDVLRDAIPQILDTAKPKDVEDDWLTHFFSKCRLVSDPQMKALWSRILAGKANHPGSFSRRTVDFVSTLSQSEAEAFYKLCRFVWVINESSIPLIFNMRAEFYEKNGITLNLLHELDSLGLIHFNVGGNGEYSLKDIPESLFALYGLDVFTISIPAERESYFPIGQILLTSMGEELAGITDAPQIEEMKSYVIDHYQKIGIVLEQS